VTIYSNPNLNIANWCSLTSTGKIAFTHRVPGNSQLYTIPITGGTPTLLYSDTLMFTECQWSPNDELIAIRIDYPGQPGLHSIRIIDAQSGAVVSEPVGPVTMIDNLKWTRAGQNKIMYRYSNAANPDATNISDEVYDVTTGTTSQAWPLDIEIAGRGSYSPSNDKVIYNLNGDLNALTIATGTRTVVKTAGGLSYMDWRR
jgi:hypothetical protein